MTRKPLALALLLALLGGGTALLTGAPAAVERAMFGNTFSRNMASGEKGLPGDWDVKTGRNVKWWADVGSQAYAGPSILGGKVFVGTNNDGLRNPALPNDRGVVMAFSAASGDFLWQMTHEKLTSGRVNDWPQQGGIVVTEIPYQLNKTTLLERIAELVREGRIPDISDLRDESDRKGMHVVIELKRGAAPRKVLNQLFKYTPLQSTFGVNHAGAGRRRAAPAQPQARAAASTSIIASRSSPAARTYLLRVARERAHILEGLRIALQFLDEVIRIIRSADSADDAKGKLIARFGLSDKQTQAILDMQLRRLAALERQKIEDEYNALLGQIAYYEALLADPARILGVIKTEVLDLKEKFGDARRTRDRGRRRPETSPRRI